MKTTTQLLAIFSFTLFIGGAFQANAQDDLDDVHNMSIGVPTVAILDLESAQGTTITLGPSVPNEAGQPLQFNGQSNNGIWLNYSSIKSTTSNPTRDISVEVNNGPLPSGINLQVQASNYTGNGDGDHGNAGGSINLSTTPQNLITGIGSCYTGDGVNNGHNLTYTLNLSGASGSYASLDADDSNTISVTYTISDN